MKTLSIRGLPDEVHSKLKERAKRNRRSLNQEVIAELAAIGKNADCSERIERLIADAERIRQEVKQPLSPSEISLAIKEDRR